MRLFMVYKIKEHLFKIKLIGAVIVLSLLLFYILPYLFSELLLLPKQNEIYDKNHREPLRVEVAV